MLVRQLYLFHFFVNGDLKIHPSVVKCSTVSDLESELEKLETGISDFYVRLDCAIY